MKLRLLSNVNMQPLPALLKPWSVTSGEHNSLLLELAAPDSAAHAAETTHLLCLFDTDVLLGDALYGRGAPEQCDALLAQLDRFCRSHPDKIVLANTFCVGSHRWLNYADLLHPASLKATEAALNAALVALARKHRNLLLIDLDPLFRRYGERELLAPAFWYVGRIRYTNAMFRILAATIRQALAAYANKARKVLVLDLDNTLWGGIVGEAGPLGIELSEDGTGRCYRDFQRALRAAQSTGVLLCISSKNNPADVDEVFERNTMMVLRREDFACIRANWQSKPENIADIAETLGLGTDSFVFLDDNPVEREIVATAFPEIAVPAFPERPERLSAWFFEDVLAAYFPKYVVTAEDTAKTSQYRANDARRTLARNLDFRQFLSDLRMECRFDIDNHERVSRVAQMTQKTNQFNLTTRRYEAPEIARLMDSPDHAVILLDYRDRFGDEGAVGLCILDLAEGLIDSFLMSCRVIGREVEDRLLDKAVELCRSRGIAKITGEFIPTRKNQLVERFYDARGFALVAAAEDGRKTYERLIG